MSGFFSEFIADPHVAAVGPSSAHLIERVASALGPSGIRSLVELGPGDGAATFPLLSRMPQDAKYYAIERNPHFVSALQRVADPRLEVIRDDAERLRETMRRRDVAAVDAVIASIPFTYLSKTARDRVVGETRALLKHGGTFIVFHQYTPLMLPVIKRHFGKVRTQFEVRNVFPCFVMSANK